MTANRGSAKHLMARFGVKTRVVQHPQPVIKTKFTVYIVNLSNQSKLPSNTMSSSSAHALQIGTSTTPPPPTNTNAQPVSYFHTQRALLVHEIAASMDNLLTQLNRLNRGLESVIAVGNEFSSVEALWSQFEGVMGVQGEEKEKSSTREEENEEAVEGATQST